MKKILMVVGAILLAALIAGGSFWGGMAYQSNQASQVRANFANARGQSDLGQFPGAGSGFPASGTPNAQFPGAFGGGGTIGTVKTIDGNVLTISTAQDVATVNLSDTTQIEKSENGSTADIQPGMRVTVSGQTDSNGNITASRITILNTDPANFPSGSQPPYPSPTGTEP
jgi:hypothetical protein